ncbi:ClbS/DfsB family four-helix bundle protein [Cytobacillus firmus]|uniref:ClbS/DfsB family four-helix bundle protein n=1 Tax=Paenibacillus lautus TaxID=1401 RepID=UPI00384FAFB6|nr:ClbS/DfsB family four-helix bundle protein [Cytobacillus firmus]
MQTYPSKEAFIAEIRRTYKLFDQEFDDVPEDKKNHRIGEVDRTPHEMIAYQLGWLSLVMSWERDERAGIEVTTPAPDYKWNQLGALYQRFYQAYDGYSLEELRFMLKQRTDEWCEWINRLTEEELFRPGVRKWTVTSANWPMWKWLHINSVSPFKSFRTKIRKWKKYVA